MRIKVRIVLTGLLSVALTLSVLCCGCKSNLDGLSSFGGASGDDAASGTPLEPYATLYATFNEQAAQTDGTTFIDTSSVSQGFVAVSAVNDAALKFQVVCGDMTYNYDLANDGTPEIFPLNCGDGSYSFHVMQNVTADKYTEIFSANADVALTSEFEPFLRDNVIVDYDGDSECVALAAELRSQSNSELDLATNIYDYITENIDYDYEEAATVAAGYVPNPDEVLQTGKGICFDYASLAAAMMRSQGIPCKVVTGYVDPDNVYHAWDVIYFEETGWVSVEIAVEGSQWKRVDLTFAATEGDAGAVGEDRTYTNRYVY